MQRVAIFCFLINRSLAVLFISLSSTDKNIEIVRSDVVTGMNPDFSTYVSEFPMTLLISSIDPKKKKSLTI